MSKEVTAYELALRGGQGELRRAFLDTARNLLVTEGVTALTLRRIAGDVGCTTKVVYTMFGSKDGLAEALYLEGFDRFRRRLLRVRVCGDPVERVRGLCRAYREHALAVPGCYRVMFEQAIPGFVPSDEAKASSRRVFDILVHGVADCVTAGRFAPDTDPEGTARTLWVALHGVVSLELAGYLAADVAGEQYAALLELIIAAHLAESEP